VLPAGNAQAPPSFHIIATFPMMRGSIEPVNHAHPKL
jgi:hypothetical protein